MREAVHLVNPAAAEVRVFRVLLAVAAVMVVVMVVFTVGAAAVAQFLIIPRGRVLAAQFGL